MVGIRGGRGRRGGVKRDSDELLVLVVRRWRRVSETLLELSVSGGGRSSSVGVEENEIPWRRLSVGVSNVAWIHEDQSLQTVPLYL